MCVRFVGFRRLEELENYFPIDGSAAKVTASYNIAPSQEILAIVRRDQENVLDLFHWGLVPFWAKDVTILKPDKYSSWLDPANQDLEVLQEIVQNWTEAELIHRPVSNRVNNARVNEASNIKPLKQTEIQFNSRKL